MGALGVIALFAVRVAVNAKRSQAQTVAIGGKARSGALFELPGAAFGVSVYKAALPPNSGVAMMVHGDPQVFATALSSLAARKREPLAVFDALVDGTTTPLMFDTPTKVGDGSEVELVRRAKVLRSFAGLVFSHDPALGGGSTRQSLMPSLTLTSTNGSITILRPEVDDPADVLNALPLPTERAPVTRKIAGTERRGISIALPNIPVSTEAYAFHVGKLPVILMKQCPPETCAALEPLFDDFAATLRQGP